MQDFEEIYRRYFLDVYRYILRLFADEHIAEDITSDTFFKAMSKIDSFRGECDVRVWLCQIAKNRYWDYCKKAEQKEKGDLQGWLEKKEDPHPLPEEEILRREQTMYLQQCLHRLSDPYKEVFMWRVFGERSFRQIGQIFGKTENWACVTYHRARKMIREFWEADYDKK